NHEYSEFVLGRRHTTLSIPIVSMAQAETRIDPGASAHTDLQPAQPSSVAAKRWNDYGIALLEQRQFGAAAEAFSRAAELDASGPSFLVNTAIADMRAERFGPEHTQFKKAATLLERALKVDPLNERARFYRALVWRGLGHLEEARKKLKAIAASSPRDREVQRQLGQSLFSLARFEEARAALESVISIDP